MATIMFTKCVWGFLPNTLHFPIMLNMILKTQNFNDLSETDLNTQQTTNIFNQQAFALEQWPHLSLQNRPRPPSQVIIVSFFRFLTQRSSTTEWQLQIPEPRETYLIKAWVVQKVQRIVFFLSLGDN